MRDRLTKGLRSHHQGLGATHTLYNLWKARHESGPSELTRPHLYCQYRPGLPLEWLRRTQSSSLPRWILLAIDTNSGVRSQLPAIDCPTAETAIMDSWGDYVLPGERSPF